MARVQPSKTMVLVNLREEAKVTQQQAAKYFGLRDRESISAWEKGESIPPEGDRRERFITYLGDLLGLRNNLQGLRQVWNEVMVEGWKWERIRDEELKEYYRGPIPIPVPFHFHFGPYEAPFVILDGDGESIYPPDNIICHYVPQDLELPPEIAANKARIAAEQEEKKLRGMHYMWNGRIYYLNRWTRGRTVKDENLELRLWFGPSDFFTFLATNMSLQSEVDDPVTGEKTKLYDKYFSNYNWSDPHLQPIPLFSNIFGVVVSLITGDNKLLIMKRPPGMGGRGDVFNIAINESVHPDFDRAVNSDAPDLYHATIRGASEELNLPLEPKDIVFFAFGVDSVYSMWNPLGCARTRYTCDEVLKMRAMAAKDKWEVVQAYPIDFEIRPVVRFVQSTMSQDKKRPLDTIWSPGALACVYYTLVNEFGRKKVDEAIAELLH
jgi:transcriptional regulator with XRE-family HTH domain